MEIEFQFNPGDRVKFEGKSWRLGIRKGTVKFVHVDMKPCPKGTVVTYAVLPDDGTGPEFPLSEDRLTRISGRRRQTIETGPKFTVGDRVKFVDGKLGTITNGPIEFKRYRFYVVNWDEPFNTPTDDADRFIADTFKCPYPICPLYGADGNTCFGYNERLLTRTSGRGMINC